MGGGTMRTAGKAAALVSYRSAAPRRASRSPVAAVPTAAVPDGATAPSISLLSNDQRVPGAPVASSIQRPPWEIDDWGFAGGMEDDLPAPRVVFGPVPTLDEAKEATSDLKDAIEKVYFSSTTTVDFKKGILEHNSGENAAVLPLVPKPVAQAFSLLHNSSEAQNVVASLASDKNVWDAVMKNEKVVEFYKTHQSTVLPSKTTVDSTILVSEELVNEVPVQNQEMLFQEAPETSVFTDIVNTVKHKALEMVNNISDFFESLLRPSVEGGNSTGNRGPAEASVDIAMGVSFIALGIAVMLVVLLKRA